MKICHIMSPLSYFNFYRKSVFLSKKNKTKKTDCVDLNHISSHLKFWKQRSPSVESV